MFDVAVGEDVGEDSGVNAVWEHVCITVVSPIPNKIIALVHLETSIEPI